MSNLASGLQWAETAVLKEAVKNNKIWDLVLDLFIGEGGGGSP